MKQKQLEDIWRESFDEKTAGKFIKAVRSSVLDGSLSMMSLRSILERCENEILTPGDIYRIKDNDIPEENKRAMTICGQVLAAEMILLLESKAHKALRKKMIRFLDISSSVVNSTYDFIAKAVDAMSYNFIDLGYGWSIVENATSLDILAYRICENSSMDKSCGNRFEFNGAGQVYIADGILRIRSSYGETASAKAFGVDSDKVQVYTPNTRTDRLKASCAGEADKLEEFARTFAASQNEAQKESINRTMQKPKPGDRVTVKITDTEEDEEGITVIKCIAIDCPNMNEGYIQNEELIRGTYTEDLIDYFCVGDCIENAEIVNAGETPTFSIQDAYTAFARQAAEADERAFTIFEAKAVAILEDRDRVNWMTAGGYGAISQGAKGVKAGDTAVLEICNIQKNDHGLFINVCPPQNGYDRIDRKFDEESIFQEFVITPQDACKNIQKRKEESSNVNADKEIVLSISRIMAHMAFGEDSLETYRRLLCADFLSRAGGDDAGCRQYEAESSYLSSCLEFAQKGKVAEPCKSDDLNDGQRQVLDVLSLAGSPEKLSVLVGKVRAGDLATPSNRILSLLISLGTSKEYPEEIRTSPDKVRKAICEILGVSDQFRAGEAIVLGKYGNVESRNLEFKSSYVMRNDGKGPDLDYQGRGQVFEAVCGFLNSDGGTVYIGVNDRTGDPIVSEEYGIKGDIRWLTENYAQIATQRYRQLGHHIPKADSLDHFVLFLNAEKELYFKESLLKNITIEATEDQDAIRIDVSPSDYEIAFLYRDKTHMDGIAYMRDGNSTKPMSRNDMEQRLMSLKSIRKEMGFIVKLQEAIVKKHKVILKNYASGNSGTIRDRFVVPVNLFYNDENVYCWDLEETAFK